MIIPMIFYKDLRIGSRILLIAPAVLVIGYVLMKLIWEGHYGRVATEHELLSGSIGLLACFNCFIAIILGAQVTAEEENAGTHLLLARLPITKARIYAEKIAAGVSCLGLLYAATLVYLSFFDLSGVWERKESFGTVPSNLFIMMASSYFFAIVCSRYTHQSIAIMFLSFGAECLLWLAIAVFAVNPDEVDWPTLRNIVLLTLLFFVAPAMLVRRQWQLPLHPNRWGAIHDRTPVRGLIWKGFAENSVLHAMCILLLLATMFIAFTSGESPFYKDSVAGVFITLLGVFLVAALGSNAYSTIERKGLHCVSYYHPVPRYLTILTKQVVAVPAIVMVSLALTFTLKEDMPPISIFVFNVFLYLLAVQMCLTYQTGTVLVILAALTGATSIVAIIGAWMIPTENALLFEGFTPVNDPLLVGLVPLAFISMGALLTTWRIATDRRFMASADSFRQRYSFACVLGVGVVTCGLVSAVREFVVL